MLLTWLNGSLSYPGSQSRRTYCPTLSRFNLPHHNKTQVSHPGSPSRQTVPLCQGANLPVMSLNLVHNPNIHNYCPALSRFSLPHPCKTQLGLSPWFTIKADRLSHSGVFSQATLSRCDCLRATVKPSWAVDAVTLTPCLQT